MSIYATFQVSENSSQHPHNLRSSHVSAFKKTGMSNMIQATLLDFTKNRIEKSLTTKVMKTPNPILNTPNPVLMIANTAGRSYSCMFHPKCRLLL